MTKTTYPLKSLTDYVAQRGGLDRILDDRGIANLQDLTRIRSRYSHIFIDTVPKVPFAPAISLQRADETAIEVLGVHPVAVWPTWFEYDIDNPEPDYAVVEDELLLGRFDTRVEFWTYVEDLVSKKLDKNERPRLLASLVPEARDYFASLPMGLVGSALNPPRLGNRRPPLAVGRKCVKGHEIESEADLYSNGPGGGKTCRPCRNASAAAQRAKKRAERAQQMGEAA